MAWRLEQMDEEIRRNGPECGWEPIRELTAEGTVITFHLGSQRDAEGRTVAEPGRAEYRVDAPEADVVEWVVGARQRLGL